MIILGWNPDHLLMVFEKGRSVIAKVLVVEKTWISYVLMRKFVSVLSENTFSF